MCKRSLVLLLFVLIGCARQSSPPQPVALPFPTPVVELRGSPAEIGTAHGARLGGPIRSLFHGYLEKYFENDLQRGLAFTAAGAFESRILPAHREEIAALAGGAQIQPREALLAQCFLDLSAMTACSTITLPANASPDHVARFGRNLDFPSFNIADKNSVLLVYHPQGKFAFASIGWPGMVGVLSGMNEHGLTLANMEVDRGLRLPSAMPYPLLYRTILEECKTVDEAIALLEKTPRQTPNNLMLMDSGGNRAVAEITPEKIMVRRAPSDAPLISTNHHRGGDLDTSGRCSRFDYLHDQAKQNFGKIDEQTIEQMLAHVAQGQDTLQSMIFEPANRVIHLAVGANAPLYSFARLDLRPYFR